MPEAEAIRLAQQGDAAAFERLYRLHNRRVYSLCLRMVSNTAEAEDLTQEAFLQLFRQDRHVSRRVGFFDLASSAGRERRADEAAEEIRQRELRWKQSPSRMRNPAGRGGILAAPDLRLSGSIDRVNLQRAVDQLPPGYKSVFVLHDVQGYEHNEIAEIMGCSIGNSKSQLHKARMRLRELLHEALRDKAREERKAAERRIRRRGLNMATIDCREFLAYAGTLDGRRTPTGRASAPPRLAGIARAS